MKRVFIFTLFIILFVNISAIENETCVSNWICGEFTECASFGFKFCLNIFDSNNCNNNFTRPPTILESCTPDCIPDWECGNWYPEICTKEGYMSRDCIDRNYCLTGEGMPPQKKSCVYKMDFTFVLIGVVVVLLLGILCIAGFILYLLNKK